MLSSSVRSAHLCLRPRLLWHPGFFGEPCLGDRAFDLLGLLEPGVQHVADEQVVDEHADDAADQRADDRYPEVVAEGQASRAVRTRERHLSPAGEVCEQPRAEVTGRVDRVSRIRAVGHADRRHGQADGQRREVGLHRRVPEIDQRHDEDQQERGADDLVDQRPGDRTVEVACGERGEDRVRRQGLPTALRRLRREVERVDRVVVHEENQGGADERADDLRCHVGKHLRPGEPAPHREG
jgi:hypothetical protein